MPMIIRTYVTDPSSRGDRPVAPMDINWEVYIIRSSIPISVSNKSGSVQSSTVYLSLHDPVDNFLDARQQLIIDYIFPTLYLGFYLC